MMNNKAEKKKSATEMFRDNWSEMHKREWLFPQTTIKREDGVEIEGPKSSMEYLEAFSYRQNLYSIQAPIPYLFPFLEKHKSQIVLSSHIANDHGCVPYTIFQFNHHESCKSPVHVIVDWLWEKGEERFLFPATVFMENQMDYSKFLEENQEYEAPLKESSLGFHRAQN